MADLGSGFTLSQLIEQVAEELRRVQQKPHENAVMEFTGCELELAVTIKGEAGGAIKLWLLDASGKVDKETVSRVKVSFGPRPGFRFVAKEEGQVERTL